MDTESSEKYKGEPWSRQPTDTEKSWQAFVHYRDLGAGVRSLSKVADFCDHNSRRYVARWNKRHNWQERVEAYDAHLGKLRVEHKQDEHLQKIEELREKQRKLAAVAMDNATLALSHSRRVMKEIQGEGEKKRPDIQTQQVDSLMRAASKVAQVAGDMHARALGVDKLLDHLEKEENAGS